MPGLTDKLDASPLFKGFPQRLFQLSCLLSVPVPHWFSVFLIGCTVGRMSQDSQLPAWEALLAGQEVRGKSCSSSLT